MLAAIAIFATAAPALAQQPAQLLDGELTRQSIQFVSLHNGQLRYFDADRQLTTASAAEYVSLRFEASEDTAGDADVEADAASAGRLMLRDGHDLPGRLAEVDDAGRIIWEHPTLGRAAVDLDDIRVIVLSAIAERSDDPALEPDVAPDPEPAGAEQARANGVRGGQLFVVGGEDEQEELRRRREQIMRLIDEGHIPEQDAIALKRQLGLDDEPLEEADEAEAARARRVEQQVDPHTLLVEGGDDRVLLRNGDELTGFIEEIDEQGVHLDSGGQVLTIAWQRIAGIGLVNPESAEPGDWLTLHDGTRVRIADLSVDSDGLRGRVLGGYGEGSPLELGLGAFASIEFTQRHRLVGLAQLEPQVVSGGVVFGVPMRPEFDREVARLHAPVVVEINLPDGARRFAADAALDVDTYDWADLEFSVRDRDGEQDRVRLNADQPRATVNATLTGGVLTLAVEEGVNGPVMARLKLENAAVLVER